MTVDELFGTRASPMARKTISITQIKSASGHEKDQAAHPRGARHPQACTRPSSTTTRRRSAAWSSRSATSSKVEES